MGALLLLPHGCSVKSWHAGAASQESLLRLCALSDCMTAYYVLVMRLSTFYVMLSTQGLLFVFDLAYNLSSEYSQLRIPGRCTVTNSTLLYLTTSAKLANLMELNF